MARLALTKDVFRALFARTGNQCAFPGCMQPLINRKNKFIGQICHIEAAQKGGQRFNPKSTDEHRRSYKNLLILCYPHHVETNDVEEYPVARLIKIKQEHEQIFQKGDLKVDEEELTKLSYKMEKYWNDIDRLNEIEHVSADSGLVMEVSGKSSFFDVMASAYDAISGVEELLKSLHASDEELQQDFATFISRKGMEKELFDDIPYYENPFTHRNWEFHNIGVHNLLQRLRIDLVHVEVKYLEEYLKTNSNDLGAKACFEKKKDILKKYAKMAMYAD